jgi:hypothetical protein
MSIATGIRRRRISADVIGGLLLVVVFGGAFFLAWGWQRQASLFPLGVSGLGFVLGVILVIRALLARDDVSLAESAHVVPVHPGSLVDESLVDEAEASPEGDNPEYVFTEASGRDWLRTVLWFGGFFLALYVLGVYVAAFIFTLLYLRYQGRRSWLFSAVYAVILVAVMYLAFTVALAQPVPSGLFGLA